MRKLKNKPQVHKVNAQATKRESMSASQLIGCKSISLLAFNAMGENSPVPFRLAAVDDTALTLWSVCEYYDGNVHEFVVDALQCAKAVAVEMGHKSAVKKIAALEKKEEKYCTSLEGNDLYEFILQVDELKRDPEYESFANIISDAILEWAARCE